MRLKLFSRSLCLILVYGPNSSALYPEFVEGIVDALRRVKTDKTSMHVLRTMPELDKV